MNPPNAETKPRHPIQVAARRTGLTPDVIRAWERRYAAVEPDRSGTNRRLYSDRDVERLLLLARATRRGRRIGDVARLSLPDLRDLVEADRVAEEEVDRPSAPHRATGEAKDHLTACLASIENLDAEGLGAALSAASVDLAPLPFVERLLLPLMYEIGHRWEEGTLRIVHEHLTTQIVQAFLAALGDGGRTPEGAPEIVVATPAGQRHELGALMVAVAAVADGWKVTYVGPDLPCGEIAAAAKRRTPRAVALSIVYPADDPRLSRELAALGDRLGEEIPLLVGGAAAPAYSKVLRAIGARLIRTITDFRSELRTLRREPPPA